MSNEVHFGPHHDRWYHRPVVDWKAPPPPPPEFPESLDDVRSWIAKAIGVVTYPRNVTRWHPALQRLLKLDEERRQKQAASTYQSLYDAPLFDGVYERRRLRILNSLFLATARMNGKPSLTRDGGSVSITFFDQRIHIELDNPKAKKREEYAFTH